MKTLNQIAETFKLYTSDNIPAIYLTSEHCKERVLKNARDIPVFLKNSDLIEIGVFYECKQDTNYKGVINYYVDNSIILLRDKRNELLIGIYKERDSKYSFHLSYVQTIKYHNMHYMDRRRVYNNIQKPHNIGVFTDKKLNNWLNYCNEYYLFMEKIFNEFNNINLNIEKEVEDIIKKFNYTEIIKGNDYVYMKNEYFNITLTHDKQKSYLKKQIKFTGDLEDVYLLKKIK